MTAEMRYQKMQVQHSIATLLAYFAYLKLMFSVPFLSRIFGSEAFRHFEYARNEVDHTRESFDLQIAGHN